ncbi:MAG: hypothetical protein IT467_01055 [Dokdonella sp.]|uniref:hypothetical protein n=1 Tax=Dokdonella sp. TaxID=2291710 RepID=UPI0025BA71D4|nr:hypothetical protein [Dokdonella sp.]MBZ0222588.1 hypothetical protein [Dokdonella sp.]MCC7254501.1 hypothetical protein [Dokdonella sp.]
MRKNAAPTAKPAGTPLEPSVVVQAAAMQAHGSRAPAARRMRRSISDDGVAASIHAAGDDRALLRSAVSGTVEATTGRTQAATRPTSAPRKPTAAPNRAANTASAAAPPAA